MIIIELDDRIVSQSGNLRGVMRYANKHGIILAHIFKNSDHSGHLTLHFGNGATCETTFADYSVLKDWIEYRLKYNPNFIGADYSFQ